MANRTPSQPLVVLGIDAGDAGFIQRWTQEGYLPTIASIMQRGCWGRIGGPELISTHGPWLSFWSGVSRSEHGCYARCQLKPGTYDLQSYNPLDAQALPFWSHLRGGSRKIACIDALEATVLEGVPGFQLANWAGRQEYNTEVLPVSSVPAGLLQDIPHLVGQQLPVDVFKPNSSLREDLEAYRLLLRRVEQKGILGRHFLMRDKYDLVVVTFSEAHTAAHRLWNYRTEGIRHTHAPNGEHELRNAIRDVYQAIDRQLGLLLQQIPDKANVFIVSLFGMKDLYPTTELSNAFCRRLGYQTMLDGASRGFNPLNHVRRIVPLKWRSNISRLLPHRVQHQLQTDQFRNETHWAKTTAFPLPSLNTSFIRVNLRGREPQGVVEPGRDYERLLNRIEADLKQLVDVRTGEPAVEKVTKMVEVYRCDPPVALPDLCIEWKASSYFMDRVAHPKVELVQARPQYDRSSYHTFSGFVAAAGPSIRAGGDLGEVSPLDFAPTFLFLMGEPLPQRLTERCMYQFLHHPSLKT